ASGAPPSWTSGEAGAHLGDQRRPKWVQPGRYGCVGVARRTKGGPAAAWIQWIQRGTDPTRRRLRLDASASLQLGSYPDGLLVMAAPGLTADGSGKIGCLGSDGSDGSDGGGP